MTVAFESVIGRYLNMTLLGRPHRLYVGKPGRACRYCVCTPLVRMAGSIAD
jgi:hypothetical protein